MSVRPAVLAEFVQQQRTYQRSQSFLSRGNVPTNGRSILTGPVNCSNNDDRKKIILNETIRLPPTFWMVAPMNDVFPGMFGACTRAKPNMRLSATAKLHGWRPRRRTSSLASVAPLITMSLELQLLACHHQHWTWKVT